MLLLLPLGCFGMFRAGMRYNFPIILWIRRTFQGVGKAWTAYDSFLKNDMYIYIYIYVCV